MSRLDYAIPTAILALLTFISTVLAAYLSVFCYSYLKKRAKSQTKGRSADGRLQWLDKERWPLIPGDFSSRPVQPTPSHSGDEEDSDLEATFKERDFSKLGRLIFVMRYSHKREELMVRLVQVEGLPISHEVYNPNSAYVDVLLKCTDGEEPSKWRQPPRLDICLQQVYYFIISAEQMLTHSLQFRVNTFDDDFRRYVSGVVEVNLSEEMGDDVFTGAEVVFVKEISSPFKGSKSSLPRDVESSTEDFLSIRDGLTDFDEEASARSEDEEFDRPNSPTPTHMSWEPEANELSISTQSLCTRCTSAVDGHLIPLALQGRAHSVGYLPTYEWTVKEIPVDEDRSHREQEYVGEHLDAPARIGYTERGVPPTPEQFYHIVPTTPFAMSDMFFACDDKPKKIAYPKRQRRAKVRRSASTYHRSTPFDKNSKGPPRQSQRNRSSSCPSVSPLLAELESDRDDELASPDRKLRTQTTSELPAEYPKSFAFEAVKFPGTL